MPANVPATLFITGGNGQSVAVGAQFASAISCQVLDEFNNPCTGVNVHFDLPSAPGCTMNGTSSWDSLNGGPTFTSPKPVADATTGTYQGLITAIPYATPPVRTTFTLTNTSAPQTGVPTSLTLSSSSGTKQTPLQTFGTQIFTLKDQNGNRMAGKTVTFTVPNTGYGRFQSTNSSTANANTDSQGNATMPTLTAGVSYGAFTLSAVVASAPSVTSSAGLKVVNAAVATDLSVYSGSGQQIDVGMPFPAPLVTLVRNEAGGPVAGIVCTITAPSSGASCAVPASGTSDANGLVSVNATANATVGSYAVTVATAGATSAVFSLTNDSTAPTCTIDHRPLTGASMTRNTGNIAWSNVNSVTGSGVSANARCSGGSPTNATQFLAGVNCGFSIPLDATVTGVIFKCTGRDNGTYAPKAYAALVIDSVVTTPSRVAFSLTNADTQFTLGQSDSMAQWERAAPTVAQVNSSGFGAAIYAISGGSTYSPTFNFGNWLLSVCYTTPGGGVGVQTRPLDYCEA